MTDALAHPTTGELLDPDDVNALRAALFDTETELGKLYRARRPLLERLGEEPYRVPRATHRTPTQERIVRCPRCGGKLTDEAAP